MSDLTDAIERTRRHWTDRPTEHGTIEGLQAAAQAAPGVRSLLEVLSEDRLALLVEPKRATVSRGTINPHLDLGAVARECEAAGACAISVVTERELSGGTIDDLRAARAVATIPVIARDLVVDLRQVYELRAAGADALLVPARVFADEFEEDHGTQDGRATSSQLIALAHQLGMEFLFSIGTEEELAFAVDTDADALNIDNRAERGNIDVERTFELLAEVPLGWPVISESIATVDEVAKLHRAGVDGLLLDEGHTETGLANALAIYADLTLDA
ncbi:MAG: Indole-3-glycerol-phosphate synthase [Thermoleophilia bacterium]|nr:Indole-3-glycerol-phosphate synthase [Thermoleophilia bacterium]